MRQEPIAKLVIRSRSGYRFEFPLRESIVTIGRDPASSLVLDDTFASRRHARIELRHGQCTVTDEGSRNGTLVNGKPLRRPHTLELNDEIQIGSTNLLFSLEGGEDETTEEFRPLTTSQIDSPIQVDLQTWEVSVEGRRLPHKLSVLEFKLLGLLYSHANQVCTREMLCHELWGEDAYTFDMLHQLMHRLKRRIESDPLNPRFLVSVPGVGYRLRTNTEG